MIIIEQIYYLRSKRLYVIAVGVFLMPTTQLMR